MTLLVSITVPQALGARRRAEVAELIAHVFGGPSLTKALALAGITRVEVIPVPPQAHAATT